MAFKILNKKNNVKYEISEYFKMSLKLLFLHRLLII